MKTYAFLLACLGALFALAGCGGGQNSSLSSPSGTENGRATITIQWPAPSRLIPAASNAVKVDITRGSTQIASKLLARPSTASTVSATFDPLPVGDLTATATAYPNADGTGTALATAAKPITIQNGQATAFTVNMASTIALLTLTPAAPQVKVGKTVTLTVTATDAAGSVVMLTPGKLLWQSSAPGVATVANGVVTGMAAGTASISVTDTESGKNASVIVTVSTTAPIAFKPAATYSIATPNEVVAADFDGDGKTDLAVGTGSSLVVFYGKGDGTVGTPQTILSLAGGVTPYAAADMDGDGKLDVVAAGSNQLLIIPNLGGRQFANPVALPLHAQAGPVAVADFNGDGKPDAAIVAYDHAGIAATDIFLFLNQGGGNYSQGVTVPGTANIPSLRAADLNGDGKADLLASIAGSGAAVYWGDGAGNFTAGPSISTTTGTVNGVVIADFNGDGKPDFAVANDTDSTISVVLNTGNGTFAAPAAYGAGSHPDHLATADFNADGSLDIVIENRTLSYFSIELNQNAQFANRVQFPLGGAVLGPKCGPLTLADLNGDGKPDVIITSPTTGSLVILINNTP